MARATDAKDPGTEHHSERVAALAFRLAVCSGWPEGRAARLRDAGLVHDVGKLAIPEAVLSKPARLTEAEFRIVQEHPALGADMLARLDRLDTDQLSWVRHHHERPDGRGYPDRVPPDDGAALLALADSWDVMISPRPYKPAMPVADALREVQDLCGRQFTHRAVRALERHLEGC